MVLTGLIKCVEISGGPGGEAWLLSQDFLGAVQKGSWGHCGEGHVAVGRAGVRVNSCREGDMRRAGCLWGSIWWGVL